MKNILIYPLNMQTQLEELKAGDKYPGWEKSFEGSFMGIIDGEIQLLVSLPYPREIDIEDFKNLTAYGIYNEQYPLVIWRFGKNFLLPTPYNPEFEKQFRIDDAEKFIYLKNKTMVRILIDQNGIVRVISLAELESSFIDDLQKAWSDSRTDWGRYNSWLSQLFRTNTYEIWKKAKKILIPELSDF